MIGAIRKLTLPIPLRTSQRGACASCQSLNTTATPSSHPKKNVPTTSARYDQMTAERAWVKNRPPPAEHGARHALTQAEARGTN